MISKLFINRPIVAMVIAIITVIVGLIAMRSRPLAQLPEIVPPQVGVSTTYIGADAVTIEQSVSTPLEQQMNGVDNMLYMQSTNANDGTEQLTVTFDVDTNVNNDQVNVQNRVAQAQPNLPTDVTQFGLTIRKSTGVPMMVVALYSPKQTYQTLFLANYANININDALYRVPGVGEVRVFGASDYAMRIWVKPDLLSKLGLSVPDLANAVKAQSTVNPSGQVGAEPMPAGTEKTYTVRAQGRLQTPEEFGQIVVRSNPDGSVVRLKDVTQPVFTAGRLKSNVKFAKAQQELALVQYQQTIQIAFRDVSDALVQYRKVKEIRTQQELLVTTLQDRSRLAYLRYQGGVDSLLNALDADRELFNAELNLAQTRRNELLSLVQLYKALGCGWQQ